MRKLPLLVHFYVFFVERRKKIWAILFEFPSFIWDYFIQSFGFLHVWHKDTNDMFGEFLLHLPLKKKGRFVWLD